MRVPQRELPWVPNSIGQQPVAAQGMVAAGSASNADRKLPDPHPTPTRARGHAPSRSFDASSQPIVCILTDCFPRVQETREEFVVRAMVDQNFGRPSAERIFDAWRRTFYPQAAQ